MSKRSQDKLDEIMTKIDENSKRLDEKMDENSANFNSKLDAILLQQDSTNKKVAAVEKECLSMQIRERLFNLRVVGLKVPEGVNTVRYVFDKLIQPILKLATDNEKSDLYKEDTPSLANCISACHFLPTKAESPPVLHLRFTSKIVRESVLKNKAAFLKKHFDNVSIFEDLTPAQRALFTATKARPEVDKVFTRSGRIKYTVKGEDGVKTAVIQ